MNEDISKIFFNKHPLNCPDRIRCLNCNGKGRTNVPIGFFLNLFCYNCNGSGFSPEYFKKENMHYGWRITSYNDFIKYPDINSMKSNNNNNILTSFFNIFNKMKLKNQENNRRKYNNSILKKNFNYEIGKFIIKIQDNYRYTHNFNNISEDNYELINEFIICEKEYIRKMFNNEYNIFRKKFNIYLNNLNKNEYNKINKNNNCRKYIYTMFENKLNKMYTCHEKNIENNKKSIDFSIFILSCFPWNNKNKI